MMTLPPALAALGHWRQFVTYLVVPSRTRPGKTDKYPTDWRTGFVADAHDPAIWCTFEQAAATGRPIGFVITKEDRFFFIDIDSALRADGTWSELATRICEVFAGAAVEVSQSLTGLHILGTLSEEAPAHRTKPTKRVKGLYDGAAGLEFYTSGRFVALTGHSAAGDVAAPVDPIKIQWLVDNFFKPEGGDSERERDDELSTEPRPEWNGPKDDDDLIRRAMMSKSASSAFGSGASFADLWTGDVEALAVAYPHETDAYDRSAADMALLSHLAFWTGCHGARMAALVWRSGLVREKWGSHATYLSLSARVACARQGNVLADKLPQFEIERQAETPLVPTIAKSKRKEGSTFIGLDKQEDFFAGCVYVRSSHRMLTPKGELLKPEVFNAHFGGNEFSMDAANARTTRKAFEAFTESRVIDHPQVQDVCFRPQLPFGMIIDDRVNTYIDRGIKGIAGDPKIFLQHVAKLLPDGRDQKILLSYLAACVKYLGRKFQWAPLIQGVEGNGKSTFAQIIAPAIGREYVQKINPAKIDSNFNSHIAGKLVIYVDEVLVEGLKVLSALKDLITEVWQSIEPKGVDQRMTEVVANWLLFTNHKFGLPAHDSERRYCYLFCAQQTTADLARDGMDAAYFQTLHGWLAKDGFAIVAHYLRNYEIEPEFDPTKDAIRAPITRFKAEAIEASTSFEGQLLQEAIDFGEEGFRCGWISSFMATRLLDRKNRRLPPRRLGDEIRKLGWIPHPGLGSERGRGRVDNSVLPDGAKTVLYIQPGGVVERETAGRQPVEIARAYTAAQSIEGTHANGYPVMSSRVGPEAFIAGAIAGADRVYVPVDGNLAH